MSERDWPSIGVIIPTCNTPEFLAQALESVLEQGYPSLRVMCVDGGTDDETARLMQKWSAEVKWVREPDCGQADAIDKGFRWLDTELVGWLNADDRYFPDTLRHVAEAFLDNSEAVLFHGGVEFINPDGSSIGTSEGIAVNHELMRSGKGKVLQPGSFMSRRIVETAGGVDSSFYLLMDLDLWIRILSRGRAHLIDRPLAQFRVHPKAKSSEPPYRYYWELLRIAWTHESDRLVRATLRRLVFSGLHHTRWLMRLSGVAHFTQNDTEKDNIWGYLVDHYFRGSEE